MGELLPAAAHDDEAGDNTGRPLARIEAHGPQALLAGQREDSTTGPQHGVRCHAEGIPAQIAPRLR